MKKLFFLLAMSPLLTLSALELDGPIGGEYVALDLLPKGGEYVEELSDANFTNKISQGYAIIDFYATWCGPCRSYGPKFTKVAEEMHGMLPFYKVNIDNAPKSTSKANVRSIPTTILYKDGVEAKRVIGSISENDLRNFIESGVSQ